MTVCLNIKPTQYVVVKEFELAVLWLNDKMLPGEVVYS